MWLQWASVLDTDSVESRNDRAFFLVEYRALIERIGRLTGGLVQAKLLPLGKRVALLGPDQEAAWQEIEAFSARWLLRVKDVLGSAHLGWIAQHVPAGDEVRASHFQIGTRLADYPAITPGRIAIDIAWDPSELDEGQLMAQIREESRRQIRDIGQKWQAEGLKLVKGPQGTEGARRLLMHLKGWTWAEVAEAESIAERTAIASGHRWQRLLEGGIAHDLELERDGPHSLRE